MSDQDRPEKVSSGMFKFQGNTYLVSYPGNKPFCHRCRKRKDVVVDLRNFEGENPYRICPECLHKLQYGCSIIGKSS